MINLQQSRNCRKALYYKRRNAFTSSTLKENIIKGQMFNFSFENERITVPADMLTPTGL